MQKVVRAVLSIHGRINTRAHGRTTRDDTIKPHSSMDTHKHAFSSAGIHKVEHTALPCLSALGARARETAPKQMTTDTTGAKPRNYNGKRGHSRGGNRAAGKQVIVAQHNSAQSSAVQRSPTKSTAVHHSPLLPNTIKHSHGFFPLR